MGANEATALASRAAATFEGPRWSIAPDNHRNGHSPKIPLSRYVESLYGKVVGYNYDR